MSTADPSSLVLSGPLTVDRLAAVWRAALARGPGLRRVELDGVGAIDSAGVALLQALRAEAARHRVDLTLSGLPARYDALCRAHRIGQENGHD
jgi:ABC-type transporter Mla MlaB component